MTPYLMRDIFRGVVGRLAFCLLFLASAVGRQQATADEPLRREAMKNFKFLVGKWSGEGEWFTAKGVLPVKVTHDVHYQQNGQTLKIDEREINKTDGKPVGFSIVVIWYDEKTGVYRVREGLAHSAQKEGVLGIDQDWRGMTIQFERPNLATREVLRVNEQSEWSEVHWMAPESESPHIFLRVTVRREKSQEQKSVTGGANRRNPGQSRFYSHTEAGELNSGRAVAHREVEPET